LPLLPPFPFFLLACRRQLIGQQAGLSQQVYPPGSPGRWVLGSAPPLPVPLVGAPWWAGTLGAEPLFLSHK
jgi:hypothetical protein